MVGHPKQMNNEDSENMKYIKPFVAQLKKKLPDRYIYAEHEGNRMVRKGDWKLVSANFRGDEWELYNIKEDRTEQHNLIKEYPEMAKELEDAYFEWADHSDVLYFPKVWNTYNKGRRKDFKEYRDK